MTLSSCARLIAALGGGLLILQSSGDSPRLELMRLIPADLPTLQQVRNWKLRDDKVEAPISVVELLNLVLELRRARFQVDSTWDGVTSDGGKAFGVAYIRDGVEIGITTDLPKSMLTGAKQSDTVYVKRYEPPDLSGPVVELKLD